MITEIVCIFGMQGTATEIADAMELVARRIRRGETFDEGGDWYPVVRVRVAGPTHGEELIDANPTRYYGIFPDCEGSTPPTALFRFEDDALRWCTRPGTHIDHAVCRVDLVGSLWNSTDGDPYAEVAR